MRLDRITRLNQFQDPSKIAESEAAVLENMILNKEGNKAYKRGAFKKHTTAGTGSVLSIFSVALNNVNYLVAKIGGTIRKYTTVWADVKTGLNSTAKLRLKTFLDGIYFCDGDNDAPMYTDLTNTYNLDITPPDISSLDNYHTAGGNLGVGRYKYVITYVTEKGEESAPSLPFAHKTTATDKTLKFGLVGGGELPVSTDARVVGRVIYRTKVDSDVFYFLTQIDNLSKTFTDDTADTDLDTSRVLNYINVPKKAEYIEVHKERLLFANIRIDEKSFIEPNQTIAESTDYTAAGITYTGGTQFNGVAS